MRVFRELKQPSVSLVLLQIWIVLVGKMAPHALDGKPLAPLEFLDERNAVEQLAVHIPRECPEHLAVVEKFPVFHQTDCCLLLKVREVDRRQDEHWERYLVPLCLSDGMEIEITPTAEPLALVDAQLGDVAVILTAHEAPKAHRMRESDFRTVEIDRQSLLLGIHIGNTRIIVDAHVEVGHADFLHLGTVQMIVVEIAHRAVALEAETRIESEAPVGLVSECQLLAVIEEHLVLSGCTEGHEEVVLIVQQVLV